MTRDDAHLRACLLMGSLRILSQASASFANRFEAGRLLGENLAYLKDASPLVLGIPRGGLVVAKALAGVLGADFDALFSLKIGSPGNPELAIGAVAEGGALYVSEAYVRRMRLESFLEEEKLRRVRELESRATLVRSLRKRIPPRGRTVILTDDGVATGATTRAALRALRAEEPARLVAAFPVGPDGAMEKLAEEADDLVCLRCPPDFMAVGQFYRDFEQVSDDEVRKLFGD